MKRFVLLLSCALGASVALAKLPALSDDAKAKAAEAAAKTAHGDKVGAFQLCQSMDRVAAKYFADAKKAGREVKPAVATPPCTDPGQFVALTPVAAKPIEAAGALAPPGTAVSPPNTKAPATATDPAPKAAAKP